MKYARFYSSTLLLILIGSVLGGCASNSGNNWNYDGSQAVPLASTSEFLPVQERDETGVLLPYEAQPNPYAELSGRIDKQSVTTYIDARRAFGAKKYEFADQLLADLTVKEPRLSGPWVMRGDIAAAQNDLAKAVEYYVTALDVNDVNFNAYLRLAKVQRQRGHFQHAQNTYALALEKWRDCPEVHLNLGVLYDVYLNQPLQAQAHMEAYQLLHKDTNQEVVAWLDEIRGRTGVVSRLKIINPDGEPEVAAGESTDRDLSVNEPRYESNLNPAEHNSQTVAVSPLRED